MDGEAFTTTLVTVTSSVRGEQLMLVRVYVKVKWMGVCWDKRACVYWE